MKITVDSSLTSIYSCAYEQIDVELPAALHTFIKMEAAKKGLTLKQYVIVALTPKPAQNSPSNQKPMTKDTKPIDVETVPPEAVGLCGRTQRNSSSNPPT